jgi:predicted acyltransferase
MLLMVLVNNAGGPRSYQQLEHSPWHGWTLTDTVFPAFLWMVGVALTLSLGKRLQDGRAASGLVLSVLKRACLLYVLGVSLYLAPQFDLSQARLLGVLQRIAICYLVVSLLYLFTGIRGQMATIIGLLALYTALMLWVPVPGYGAGNWTVEGNFAHYVDRLMLRTHNYARTKTWDPEGIVSTLPAIATTLLGVMAGHVLRRKSTLRGRIGWLLLLGAVLFSSGEIWNHWMPINKKLWSASFTLLMAGLDFLILAVLLWLVDVRGHTRAVKPLLIVGRNSIAVYLASEILAEGLDNLHAGSRGASLHELLYNRFFAPLGSMENASLLWALSFTGLMYVWAYFLYKKSWFWRI